MEDLVLPLELLILANIALQIFRTSYFYVIASILLLNIPFITSGVAQMPSLESDSLFSLLLDGSDPKIIILTEPSERVVLALVRRAQMKDLLIMHPTGCERQAERNSENKIILCNILGRCFCYFLLPLPFQRVTQRWMLT